MALLVRVLCIAVAVPMLFAQSNLTELARLVSVVKHQTEQTPVPGSMTDIAADLHAVPEYKQLVALCVTQSTEALQNLNFVAPDRHSRAVLFHAFEDLSATDFLAVANLSLDLVVKNEIGEDEFLISVLLPQHKKQWFWSYNYQVPEVIDFLTRVRATFAHHPDIPSLTEFMLSGRARIRDERLRKENAYLRAQPIPFLRSPVAGNAEVSPNPSDDMPQFSAANPSAPASPNAVAHHKTVAHSRRESVGFWVAIAIAALILVAGLMKVLKR